jgi:predicted DNA binding CopG/RHH family protein
MARLEKSERELLSSVESGKWRPVARKHTELERYRESARATFKKDRRINIRISSKDLDALQKRAVTEGIPYQALISSILHKYASGRLKEQGL